MIMLLWHALPSQAHVLRLPNLFDQTFWKDFSQEITTTQEPPKATTEPTMIDVQDDSEVQTTETPIDVLPTPTLITEKALEIKVTTEKAPEKKVSTKKASNGLEEAKMILRFLQNKINFLEEKLR